MFRREDVLFLYFEEVSGRELSHLCQEKLTRENNPRKQNNRQSSSQLWENPTACYNQPQLCLSFLVSLLFVYKIVLTAGLVTSRGNRLKDTRKTSLSLL